MTQNINAEVISIGTEILLGELTDTNSVFIARMLRDLGINLYYMTSVGDNRERIANAVRIARSRAQVVITCGGLGPTVDDMTRQSVADATERGLTFHQELLDQIAARFQNFRSQMTENNKQQAYLPDNAIVIENPVGTAPSFIVEQGDGAVISLPGVPREMKFLMQERVVPYLRQKYQLGIIKAHTLRAAGIGESTLDDLIGHEILEASNPTVGLAAHHGQIDVRITAKAATEAEADAMIAVVEAQIMAKVGRYIYGKNDDTLEHVLISLLQPQNKRLAVVQAGLGDMIQQALRMVDGGKTVLALSEDYADPSAVYAAYSVAPGTPLREAAAAIGEAAAVKSGAYATIVIISQPDVDEASDSTESSVVAVYQNGVVRDRVYGFGGKSEVARSWMTRWSLSYIWQMLKEESDAVSG